MNDKTDKSDETEGPTEADMILNMIDVAAIAAKRGRRDLVWEAEITKAMAPAMSRVLNRASSQREIPHFIAGVAMACGAIVASTIAAAFPRGGREDIARLVLPIFHKQLMEISKVYESRPMSGPFPTPPTKPE